MDRIKAAFTIFIITALLLIALQQAFEKAIDKKIREVEIIPGKGRGQLRKKVERFCSRLISKTISPHRKRQQEFWEIVCVF